MTKQTFREAMKENNTRFKQGMKEDREKRKVEAAKINAETKAKIEKNKADFAEKLANRPTEAERVKRTLTKGFALWLAIPAIMFILIVGLLVVVGLYDWFIGLFR